MPEVSLKALTEEPSETENKNVTCEPYNAIICMTLSVNIAHRKINIAVLDIAMDLWHWRTKLVVKKYAIRVGSTV